jgi:hypothetical protein
MQHVQGGKLETAAAEHSWAICCRFIIFHADFVGARSFLSAAIPATTAWDPGMLQPFGTVGFFRGSLYLKAAQIVLLVG